MKARNKQKGFTLIEIMIAIFVLAVALLGLAEVTTTTIKGNSFSKSLTTATTLANDKMQDLKAKNFTCSSTGCTVHADLSSGSHTDTGNPIQGIYNRSWSIADTNDSASRPRYKAITVTAEWTWQGSSHNVQLQTFRARD